MSINTRLVWNGEKEKKQMASELYKALIRATNKVQSDAKLFVRKDTTNLEQSIVTEVDKKDLIGTVLTDSEYAFPQEFGLRATQEYGFTPYLRPALNNNKNNIKNIFIKAGRDAVDK